MKIQWNSLENEILFLDDFINVVEIENKHLFCAFIEEFRKVVNGEIEEGILTFYEEEEEVSYSHKIECYIDYFSLDFNSKKILNSFYQRISKNMEESGVSLFPVLLDFSQRIKNYFLDFDFDVTYDTDLSIVDISKFLKVKVNDEKKSVFERILLLLDLESEFRFNKILVFVNLKSFLTKEEVVKVYRYSKMKKVWILLLEGTLGGVTLEYEKKLIIYDNLDEIVL